MIANNVANGEVFGSNHNKVSFILHQSNDSQESESDKFEGFLKDSLRI